MWLSYFCLLSGCFFPCSCFVAHCFESAPVWLYFIYNRHARSPFIRSHRRIFKYRQPKQRTGRILGTSNCREELRQGRAQRKLTFEENLHLQAQHYGNNDANAVTFVRARTPTAIEKHNINLRSVVRSHQNIRFVRHQPKAWLCMCYLHTLVLCDLMRALLKSCSRKYMKNIGNHAWSSTISLHFTEWCELNVVLWAFWSS